MSAGVSVAALATLGLGLAGPAAASTSPQPLLPISVDLAKLGAKATHGRGDTHPGTSNNHKVGVKVPGVASIEVQLPDVSGVLHTGRGSKAPGTPAPQPTTPRPTTPAPRPTTSTPAPSQPAASAATTRPESAAPAPAAGRTTHSTAHTRAQRTGTHAATGSHSSSRTRSAVPVVVPVARPKTASKGEPHRTRTLRDVPRTVAEAFQGMVHTGLPVWLLAGIVTLCAAGTVVVVRSGRRRESA